MRSFEVATEVERVAARHPTTKIAMVSRPPDDVRSEVELEAAWDALAKVAKRPVIFQTYGTDKTPTPSVAPLLGEIWRRYEAGERGLKLTEAYAMYRLTNLKENLKEELDNAG